MKTVRNLLVTLALVVMTGCFGETTHNDWKVEAEVTNQMQLHEHGLTQREALMNATVGHAIDQIEGGN